MLQQQGHVVTAKRLDHSLLTSLCERTTIAARIPEFYPPPRAREIAEHLECDPAVSPYPLANDARSIDRWGLVFLGAGSADSTRYHELAQQTIDAQRALCSPDVSPLDLLRLTLEEAWPAGAHLENFDGRPMSFGFARLFRAGAQAKPHLDSVSWALPHCPKALQIRVQLAANIYLKTAPDGGELELWPFEPTSDEYGALVEPGSYGLRRSELPAPALRLMPRAGELILFRSTCVHAVAPSSSSRIAFSCSVSYRAADSPLGYWS